MSNKSCCGRLLLLLVAGNARATSCWTRSHAKSPKAANTLTSCSTLLLTQIDTDSNTSLAWTDNFFHNFVSVSVCKTLEEYCTDSSSVSLLLLLLLLRGRFTDFWTVPRSSNFRNSSSSLRLMNDCSCNRARNTRVSTSDSDSSSTVVVVVAVVVVLVDASSSSSSVLVGGVMYLVVVVAAVLALLTVVVMNDNAVRWCWMWWSCSNIVVVVG